LHVSSVTRRWPHGSTGRPRRESTSWWCSTSCGASADKLLRHEGVDLGGLLVGSQAEIQNLRDAGLGVDLVLLIDFLLVLLTSVGVHEVERASGALLVLQNLDELERVLLDLLVRLEARLLHLHDDIRRDVRR
jgi:hypothetical protein